MTALQAPTSKMLSGRHAVGRLALHLVLIFLAIVFMGPFYWMIISSLRPLSETTAFPVQLLPSTVSIEAYVRLLSQTNFGRTLVNSLIVAVVTTGAAVFFCSLAGYAFALLEFKGRRVLFALVLGTMLVPVTAQIVPNYFVMAQLGLLNTWWALILPSAAPAIGTFWMRQYIAATIPRDLIDAARVDGSGEFSAYWRIVLPLSLPGLLTLAIFIASVSWNDFVLPFVYLSSADLLTFPARLVQFFPNRGQVQIPYDLIMAGAVLSALPMLALYFAFQRYMVAGLTLGSGK